MSNDTKPTEPLLHKVVTIVVGEISYAAREAFNRWHRERLARRRAKREKRQSAAAHDDYTSKL